MSAKSQRESLRPLEQPGSHQRLEMISKLPAELDTFAPRSADI